MGYTYAKQSAIYLNFEFNWVSFIFIAKSGFCKQRGSLSFRDVGSERDPTFPLHPSPPGPRAPGPGLVSSERVAGGRQGK